MVDIVMTPQQITPEWLTLALRENGILTGGRVVSAESRLFGTGKLGDNARISLTYEGDAGQAPTNLVAKLPASDERARMMAGAQGAYYNEVKFYQQLAGKTSMRTPYIYAGEIAEDKASYFLLMEDMAPSEPGDQLKGESIGRAEIAVKEAAKLHAAFWGDDSLAERDSVLYQMGDAAEFGGGLMTECWPGFLERYGESLSLEQREFGDKYIANHTQWVQRFSGARTLVHSDYRSENMLFSAEGTVCIIDWQTPTYSSGLADISYFLGGSLTLELRRAEEKRLVELYRVALEKEGVTLSQQECWEQYREFTMHGMMLTVLGSMFSEREERSDKMFTIMAQRHLQHCVDLEAADFL
ncbi:MAG: phosphotransferase [Pseudomonadales bacterium]